ncbi:hemicentin-2-like [Daktulosphaira vitifoliae]|uniref:hemicentin-2-like n=1 Tax=Daktulosphaira vitifoliae TaxID=58002 RepID=UPI0021A9B8AD|nr:hemicentin-2-like [Daktulosphaira vitifoliae]XP_050524073.1 hemicentin-2-like [Daktulosphaira vitifoliae]XP_050524074.1 hemicentin-2-like [Daktulosphaira vitifoliae]
MEKKFGGFQIFYTAGLLLFRYLTVIYAVSLNNSSVVPIENSTGNNSNIIITDLDHEKISPFWSFNDSAVDLTKYEQFDHQRFIETVLDPELVQPTSSSLPKIKNISNTKRKNFTKTYTLVSPPIFDGPNITNATARLGESAFLHCTVRNLQQRPVSWVRRRDWHILSSDVFMYTNDERFHVLHADNADNWDLQIKYVQKRDAGSYECQVAMGTGIASHYFNLEVIVPIARILGREEYHVGKGSTINLICVIKNGSMLTHNVVWIHNGRPIDNSTNNKNDYREVKTEILQSDNTIQSRLFIRGASQAALGNYTCTAPNTEPDTVNVYVSEEGDNIAAIQRHGTSSSPSLILMANLILATPLTLHRLTEFL